MKERRDELGLSQDEVAERVGVSRQQVSLWENGHRSPRSENLVELARVLRVPVGEISAGGPQPGHDIPLADDGRVVIPVDLAGHPLQSDVEVILSWLPENMSARWAGEVTTDVRLAQVYAYGAEQGWSAARLEYIHRIREELRRVR